MAGTTKEREELDAIQAQLQLDRARLTSEISDQLTSTPSSSSPSKSNSKGQKNPFSMPGNSSDGSASSFSSPFAHRPATLGLGAEQSDQDRKQTLNGVENVRLKGALMGKRKRGDDPMGKGRQALDEEEDGEEEESKSEAIGKGKAKAKGKEATVNGAGKGSSQDPFASKKGKGKGKTLDVKQEAVNQIVDGEQTAKLSKSARKRLRKRMKMEAEARGTEADSVDDGSDGEAEGETGAGAVAEAEEEAEDAAIAGSTGNKEANGTSMTAHQKSLMSHLSGARFRQINETLYTTSSSSALSYIQGEPSKLREYHEGFREQVKGWPKVPVRQIAEKLLKAQKKSEGVRQQTGRGRSAPGALVVDLGAGEAILAKLMAKGGRSSSARVLSYDLLDSQDGWVKGLDIAKLGGLPLPGSLQGGKGEEESRVVDVAVFCLSLMGTNWVEMIMEASRVTRTNGELIIAEVTSRFNTKADFISVVSSLGFKLVNEDSSNSHFVLFEFVKLSSDQWQSSQLVDEQGRAGMIEKGAAILKPCIYKRR